MRNIPRWKQMEIEKIKRLEEARKIIEQYYPDVFWFYDEGQEIVAVIPSIHAKNRRFITYKEMYELAEKLKRQEMRKKKKEVRKIK